MKNYSYFRKHDIKGFRESKLRIIILYISIPFIISYAINMSILLEKLL